MAWKPSKTFWIIDGLILGALLLFSVYRVATRIAPLPVTRVQKRLSPEEQIHVYYRQYPEGYLKISRESWKLDEIGKKAAHSFTIANTSKVTYNRIELRFRYQDHSGKYIKTMSTTLRDAIKPGASLQIRGLTLEGVPAEAMNVVLSIAKAEVNQ